MAEMRARAGIASAAAEGSAAGGKPTFASIGASDKAALKAAVEAFLRIALPLRLASSQPPTRN